MSFDEALGARVRALLSTRPGVVEKKMFGGLAFMVDGRMACGVLGSDLVVRVGPARDAEALAQPHARPMDFTGRPMAGYVYVAPAGCRGAAALERWVRWGVEHVAAMPPKARAPSRREATRRAPRRT